ncbi:MAG: glucosaminidase domain-containing protein [Alphaproteobacteria bacterium]|nr:glucosaminidase domain-containing protein [Alphaproteobacteria bacterium]
MSKVLAASLVAVVFSAALFIYSVIDPGPYGATEPVAGATGSRGPVPLPARASGSPSTDTRHAALGPDLVAPDATRSIGLHVASMDELLAFYDAMDFGVEFWRPSEKGVPPVILADLPDSWVADLGSGTKKSLFYRAVLPLVLQINNEIMADRATVLVHIADRANGNAGDRAGLARLGAIAIAYGVLSPPPDKGKPFVPQFSAAVLKQLATRVDAIPVSMALGQAAYESGYTTSRFATGDNSLFGPWRDGDGMRPRGRRVERGNEGRYATALDSTRAYARNLNTHPAYEEFRGVRATMRAETDILDGHALAAALVMYSQSGVTYTNTLRALIAENNLSQVDAAVLRDEETVRVVAVIK